jgi:hypothetical protein
MGNFKQGWYTPRHPEKYVGSDVAKIRYMSKQGWYTPRHPEKYVGSDVAKIRYMSSWELSTHRFLDNNSNILKWSSESIAIPYIKPTDNKVHRYFPDYWIQYRNRKGQLVQEIWEVKPLSQTKKPRATRRKSPKTRLYEDLTYAINISKWQSAKLYCDKYGMTFRIMTEKDIYR